ncbi:conserved oligomeric golgi complex [Lynx pardinus]|uniref:Conserved oligomeric Golgi complex subunit 8 n=1 Tax=Lynx pardinus TaxID=191816 RepID=A0A485NCE6_LYNPA|nr:conserved oligomeric golgi complex [Lynx pardinus]
MAATETLASSTTATASASAAATATAAALGEVEDEGLLASLFRDRFPEAQWRERPDVGRYLRELSGSGLERLRREPERLAEERAQLLQQTRDLAFANYKTFIRGAECTERIHRLFGDVEASLGRLLDRLPSFQQSCRNFVKEAEEISSNRRMNTLTLNRHTEILEILEIPQLMDTCVRNSYYEEALELAAYVRRLERKYSSIPVIQGIVNEVRQSMQLMLSQLIQQLRTNIQLPACLRVIGFLRRMDIFTEAELRVKFLQARDAWLRSILTAIPNDDPYFHITKTIEACRVHLFDIITQYRAIFSDEDPLLPPAMGEHTVNESAIFHGWVLQRVSQFLQVLETDLNRGIGGRLDSLLGQCMYFGLSFSRVGADFRGQLAPVFQQVAISTFQKAIQEAVEKFQDEMNSYTLISAPAILGSSNLPAAVPVTQPGTLQPPMVLLDFPPLACFLNSILVAFNDLRLCCPVALAQDVTGALENALAKVTNIILAFHRAEEAAFSSGEQELFIQFCTVFVEDLVPYLNRCLQVLFPPAQIAQTLGIPPTQLSKYGNLGHVNIDVVQEPLAFILPKRELVLCLDEKELVPELPAPAPEVPPEESGVEPVAAAFPEGAQEQADTAEPLQAEVPGARKLRFPASPATGALSYGGRGGPRRLGSCARRTGVRMGAGLLLGPLLGRSRHCLGPTPPWGEGTGGRSVRACSSASAPDGLEGPARQRSYWRYVRRLVRGAREPPYPRVCQVGDPALRAVAAPVEPAQLAGPELQRLVQRLVQVMRRRRCVGLSAPQLGVPLQVLALEFPEALFRACAPRLREARQMEPFPLRVFVNPSLRVLDSRLVTFPEGCESVVGFLACVPRFQAVQISGLDPRGEQVVWQASGWAARIIQHEMDHLQGCLFIDKMDSKTFTNIHWMEVND